MSNLNPEITLKAYPRDKEIEGAKPAILAELYGPELENKSLKLEVDEFMKVFEKAGYATLINLEIEGGDNAVVVVRQVQSNPLKPTIPHHVDLMRVHEGRPITVKVDIEPIGSAKAIRDLGGILVQNLDQVKIKALPKDLVSSVPVDMSGLSSYDDVVRLEDIELSEEIEVLSDPRAVVLSVVPPKKTGVSAAAEEEAEEEGEEGEGEAGEGEEGEDKEAEGKEGEGEDKQAKEENK